MEQMCFSGVSGCPNFHANPFRKNICSLCQSRIQDHSGASDQDIANAIEYSADNVPTLILQRPCRPQNNGGCGETDSQSLYMGGYKSALNVDFLRSHKIGLIICAAKNLEKTFGVKYASLLSKRRRLLPEIQEENVGWNDTVSQILEPSELHRLVLSIFHCPSNVLVHCAQGKSRSAVICICVLATLQPTVAISELANQVKSKRDMAEANPGFMDQLIRLQKNGFFNELSDLNLCK